MSLTWNSLVEFGFNSTILPGLEWCEGVEVLVEAVVRLDTVAMSKKDV